MTAMNPAHQELLPRLRREIAQIGSHASLELLDSDYSPRWTYSRERVVRNLTALGHHLFDEVVDSEDLDEHKIAVATLIAHGWHQLALLEPSQRRSLELMTSALYYELCGYQANASCLARLAIHRSKWTSVPSLDGLISAFVQRLFVGLVETADSLIDPPTTDDIASQDDLLRRASQALTARGLKSLALHFLSGHDSLVPVALDDLHLAQEGFGEVADAVAYNSVTGLLHIVPLMVERSTWRNLRQASDSPRWQRYIQVLARGLGSEIRDARSISELWPSQRTALESGLLDSDHSMAIRMPTSAGKTRIAEMAIVNTLVSMPDSRCVYVAPYRALAGELADSFTNLLLDLGYGISAVPGGFDQEEMGEEILATDQVLIVTPEKLDLLFRLGSDGLDRVALVVIDEGHIVSDKQRGPKFELLISRLRRNLPSARFLMMSAVVPDETLNEFAAWLGSSNGRTVSTDWRPSILRHGKLEWSGTGGTLRFSQGDVADGGLEFIPKFIRQRVLEHVWPATGRIRRPKFPRSDSKSDVAAEVAFQVASLGPVLIFAMQTNWVEAIAASLLRRIEWTELAGDEIPPVFHLRDASRSIHVAKEWLGADHDITRLLRRNIAFHHGRLPSAVREAIESDFRNNNLSVMVSTNTLAQGVNLPVRTVIIHNCRSQDYDGTPRILTARDYWNIAGRAGRAGAETEGTVIHISFTRRDADDFEQYSTRRFDVERVDSALFNMLQDLVHHRISSSDAAAQLDADLLALLVEEDDTGIEVENLTLTLSSSLFNIQAEYHDVDSRPILEVMSDTASLIGEAIPSTESRRLYASTGLSSYSCRAISVHVANNNARISHLLREATYSSRDDLIDLLLEGLSEVREMEPRAALSVDTQQVLTEWCEATPVCEIAELFDEDPQDLTEYIEDYFNYRLPWGISGYLRIAANETSTPVRSPLVRNIAGMLKFGLPSPEAVWAMSAGVASRTASLAVADAYLSQHRERSAADFRRWLGRLDIESLAERLDLSDAELDMTARAVLRAQPNEHLAKLDDGAPLLPLAARCKPLKSAYESGLVYEVNRGSQLGLRRDRDSRLNRNAVLLTFEDQRLGYLAVDAARALAPDLDAGLLAEATVARIRTKKREIRDFVVNITNPS